MIRSGQVKPFLNTHESKNQVTLSVHNACSLAKNFNDFNFNVIIDDIVASKEKLDLYFKLTGGYRLLVFLLTCELKVLAERDLGRDLVAQQGKRVSQLHDKFSSLANETRWNVIDTTNIDKKETVDFILKIINKK